jgi:N-acetyl sugar amidotransferase
MSKMCSKCVLDTSDDPDIYFNEAGVCNYCIQYDYNVYNLYFGNQENLSRFKDLIQDAKIRGRGAKYDVLIGLSGGVDSTFVAYLCWKEGLRALAVHLDNGWNSELSVSNIKSILQVTGFDYYTYVINWEEFKDLQRAYFKANVVDIEVLTDHAIGTVLSDIANKNKIKYVFDGSSITTEGRLPNSWVYNKSDSLNILDIHKRFGTKVLKTYPLRNYWLGLFKTIFSNLKVVSILDYYPYDKEDAKKKIIEEFLWRDYGGKHYESIFTRFYQAYILPKKFNIDKRKSHYSTLICANQMSKTEAIELLKKPTYEDVSMLKSDYDFVVKKLDFTPLEFENYMSSPSVPHTQYKSIESLYNLLRPTYKLIKRILSFRTN